MAEKDDKAKKLEEIQKRLAEIQGKSTPTPKKEAQPVNKPIPEPPKPETKSADVKSAEATTPPPKIKTESTPAPPPPSEPKAVKKEVKADVKAEKSEKRSTQEDKNWRANRMLTDTDEKKSARKKSGLSMSKIYTVVSLVITLLVISYFIYALFLDKEDVEVATTELPVEKYTETTVQEEDIAKAEEAFEEMAEEELSEEVAEAVIEPKKAPAKTVPEKRQSKPEKPAENAQKKDSAPIRIAQMVPKGIIISYASNSQKNIAESNVRMLQSKGFAASYYYMPDKDASSPALYKVYVGPYSSESEAMPDFKKVVDLNPKAFILRLN